jgi:ATP-dependent DNA ligase
VGKMTINKDIFMLCQPITEAEVLKLDEKEYVSQEKKDGERLLAIINQKGVCLFNRRGSICNFNFAEIVEDLKQSKYAILDCEIVSQDEKFENCQRRALTKDRRKIEALQKTIPLWLYAFDILQDGDEDLRTKPLKERLERLDKYFKGTQFKFCKKLETKPIKEMLEICHKKDAEGIVVKKINSVYSSSRSPDWKKFKFWNEEDIKFSKFEENPKGIRVETNDGKVACQVAGENSIEVKDILKKKGEVTLTIQYLEKFGNEGNYTYRFPSYKKIVY